MIKHCTHIGYICKKMNMRSNFSFLAGLILFVLSISGCRDDELLTDHISLGFSTDTVYFDTLLATLGSVTQAFLVYNDYNQPVEMEKIYLARAEDSYFRLNLDGKQGLEFTKVQIPAKDSLFIFVEATIDPLDASNPILIKDSVVFESRSDQQDVKLIAYGQDVHVFNGEIFDSQTWTNEKPYLIVNSAAIDSNEILTIDPGARVYLTSTSSLIVWGRIEATGTAEDPIIFSGARFDGRFEVSAGQWGTIFITPRSTGNLLDHVIIRNAIAGIQVGHPDGEDPAAVELRNCMIVNSSAMGIFAFNARIDAYNTIIADCGSLAVLIQLGGTYNFYHCVISNISAYYEDFIYQGDYKYRSNPSLFFTNFYEWFDLDEEFRVYEVTLPEDVEVNFYNSIIYGTNETEVYYWKPDDVDAALDYRFDHCLLKMHPDSVAKMDSTKLISIILNENPAFINDSIAVGEYDFQLADTSVAINAGDPGLIEGIWQLEKDFNGNLRTGDEAPDLGAYEF